MGRPDYIFGPFRETARCRDAQHGDGVCCACFTCDRSLQELTWRCSGCWRRTRRWRYWRDRSRPPQLVRCVHHRLHVADPSACSSVVRLYRCRPAASARTWTKVVFSLTTTRRHYLMQPSSHMRADQPSTLHIKHHFLCRRYHVITADHSIQYTSQCCHPQHRWKTHVLCFFIKV